MISNYFLSTYIFIYHVSIYLSIYPGMMPAALGLTGLPQLTHAPQQPGSLPATNPHQQLQQLTAASLPPQYTQHLGRIDR